MNDKLRHTTTDLGNNFGGQLDLTSNDYQAIGPSAPAQTTNELYHNTHHNRRRNSVELRKKTTSSITGGKSCKPGGIAAQYQNIMIKPNSCERLESVTSSTFVGNNCTSSLSACKNAVGPQQRTSTHIS